MLPLPETTTATRKPITHKYITGAASPAALLHIRCGDDILGALSAAGIPGAKVRWADPLCEGPVSRPISDAIRRRERARFLADRYRLPLDQVHQELVDADQRVDACTEYRETVLWFEADLFDQAILVYLIARLYPRLPPGQLTLICIDRFPGVKRFVGLGQLSPAQLKSLFPRRKPVTQRQFDLAAEAWAAFAEPSGRWLARIARRKPVALPFLPAAIRRYLAEAGRRAEGVAGGLTAKRAWKARQAGARTPEEAFVWVQEREDRPFMGDASFYALLREIGWG